MKYEPLFGSYCRIGIYPHQCEKSHPDPYKNPDPNQIRVRVISRIRINMIRIHYTANWCMGGTVIQVIIFLLSLTFCGTVW
jgi:hypothetical protein